MIFIFAISEVNFQKSDNFLRKVPKKNGGGGFVNSYFVYQVSQALLTGLPGKIRELWNSHL